MVRIAIDLSSLVFIRLEGSGALFVDGDGDEIKLYVTGAEADWQAAKEEILKATEASL